MTSLEEILEKNNISKYRLVEAIALVKNSRSYWNDRITGKSPITEAQLQLIVNFLSQLGIKDEIQIEPDKYFIV